VLHIGSSQIGRQGDQCGSIVDEIESPAIRLEIEKVSHVITDAFSAESRKRRFEGLFKRNSLFTRESSCRNFREIDANDLMAPRKEPGQIL